MRFVNARPLGIPGTREFDVQVGGRAIGGVYSQFQTGVRKVRGNPNRSATEKVWVFVLGDRRSDDGYETRREAAEALVREWRKSHV